MEKEDLGLGKQEELELREQVQLGLGDLYTFWYGHPNIIKITKNKILKNTDFPISHVEEIWKSKWFAKGDEQKKMDIYLLKFESLLQEQADADTKSERNIFEHIARVILFDQIPRNIYRSSANAYKYDQLARNIVKAHLLPILYQLPLHVICTALICLLHSENLEDQELVEKEIEFLKKNYKMEYSSVILMLGAIHKNHFERVKLFGRIPERNVYLGRESTGSEINYMVQMDPSIVIRCTPFKF